MLGHLISVFIDMQKRGLIKATQAVADLQKIETVDDAIGAAKLVLTAPGRSLDPGIWLAAQKTADKLLILAARRLDSVAHTLSLEIGPIRPELQFTRGTSYDLIPTDLPYKPNKLEYERIAPLRIINMSRYSSIEVQAHAVGFRFRGLIAMVVVFGRQNDAVVASKDFFQVNYAESYESAERRFRPWLEESLVNALTLWRKSL
jgi:hypothetical protein